MYGTIESTHNKITDKIKTVRCHLDVLIRMATALTTCTVPITSPTSKKAIKYANWRSIVDSLHFHMTMGRLDALREEYDLTVAPILGAYYRNQDEAKITKDYYRCITSINISGRLDLEISVIRKGACILAKLHRSTAPADKIADYLAKTQQLVIDLPLERQNWEVCKCGGRMQINPELSERQCLSPDCMRVKKIVGAVFRDDQFYPTDGQKTKHGGYDTSRHYRFWMERLQALEPRGYTDEEEARIRACIAVDRISRHDLTCERMRKILKDPSVNATHLNDHAALLVKLCGGRAPPQLTMNEFRTCSVRFNRAMKLYEIVNTDDGNKPYYPYFIYKILEHMFRNDPEKLRLIDYIHLQSRETVIKNDKYFEQMCELALPEDGLVYTPTDPAGRL